METAFRPACEGLFRLDQIELRRAILSLGGTIPRGAILDGTTAKG